MYLRFLLVLVISCIFATHFLSTFFGMYDILIDLKPYDDDSACISGNGPPVDVPNQDSHARNAMHSRSSVT